MDGMMRLPQQRVIASPRLGGSPPITTTDTGYPWVDGDVLCAADLNAAIAAGGSTNVGRNLLHNPLMGITQRGTGPFTANNGLTADRWRLSFANDTLSISILILGDSDRAAIGDEAARVSLRVTFTGSPAANSFSYIGQSVEDVRRLAGKTVTLSFWSNAGAPFTFGVNYLQTFGTGGSPSASVWVNATGQTTAAGVTWARHSVTTVMPSVAGKTFGTNVDDFTQVTIWFSGTSQPLSGISTQSGVTNIWGVQLEIGAGATPLEKPDLRYDLANCQRFYQITHARWGGFVTTGWTFVALANFAVTMRASPTCNITTDASLSMGARSIPATDPYSVSIAATASATSGGSIDTVVTASADL